MRSGVRIRVKVSITGYPDADHLRASGGTGDLINGSGCKAASIGITCPNGAKRDSVEAHNTG